MLYSVAEVMGIKLAAGNLESTGLSAEQVLCHSICWLIEKYEETRDTGFLQKSIWHMYAYLELGFSYQKGKELFEKGLGYLNLDMESVFSEKKWNSQKAELSKTSIMQLLGRWNPRVHSMKIEDAALDILEKISDKKVGQYTYHSGKVIARDESGALWENTFKLIIREEETIFYNVNKNKYYVFE